MAVVIKGSGIVEGIAVGGLPDGIVDTDMIAANAVVTGKITDGTIATADLADSAVTAAKRGSGTILQVQGNLNTGGGTSTTTTDAWVSTYITDTITPVALNSKIIVMCSNMAGYLGGSSSGYANATLGRNVNSEGWSYLGGGTNGMGYMYNIGGYSTSWYPVVTYLDTPTYTSGEAIVYTMFIRATSNATPCALGNGNCHSPIVLMEVSA